MLYFEGVDIKRVELGLKAVETDIVAVFHNESIFRANKDRKFCRLGNNEIEKCEKRSDGV